MGHSSSILQLSALDARENNGTVWKGSIVTNPPIEATQWRASGAYVPTLAGKASFFQQTRLLLEEYAQSGEAQGACKTLIDGVLSQRSRETRVSIVKVLRERLFRWRPPTWVLTDLITFARTPTQLNSSMVE